MNMSHAINIFLLCAIATCCVLAVFLIRLKIKGMFMGFQLLKTEADIAKVTEKSRVAKFVRSWLAAPSKSPKKAGLVNEFMDACARGDLNTVNRLIRTGINVDVRRAPGGKTGLMLAALGGSVDVVQFLLNRGASVNAAGGRSGKSALIRAAERGNLQIAKALLQAGARINGGTRVSGTTALMAAVENGNLEMTAFLIKSGADVNLRNRAGQTCADIAMKHGRGNILELLRAFQATFSDHSQNHEARRDSEADGIDKYYAVLGCKKTDSIDTIKAQYRQLIKQYHPDVIQGKGLPEGFIEFANNKFTSIVEAYDYIIKKGGSGA
jgi:hypothetical protein